MADEKVDVEKNVNIWKNAEVYVSDNEDAQIEADGTFGDAWLQVGMLAGGSSIGQERDADRNEVEGWGAQLITTEQKFKKDTRTFTALEDTATTFGLLYPNSKYNEGGVTIVLAPEDAKKVIAFKTTNQHGKALIEVSRVPANIYPSSMDKNDDGASSTEFTAEVRKDADGALYERATFDEDATNVNPEITRFKQGGGSKPTDPEPGKGDGGAEGE